MNSTKISACIITYNQASYIKDCIEGALKQKHEYDYEIVIGDDCSTDGTSEICKEYQKKFPELIKYNRRNQNLGMNLNWVHTINECTGNYIALCEGDDFWTDLFKLKKQVDFLESNNNFAMTFSNVIVRNENNLIDSTDFIAYNDKTIDGNQYVKSFLIPKAITNIYDIAKGNYIHTTSVLIRNVFKKNNIPEYLKTLPIVDWPLYMFVSRFGLIKYFNEPMAVYRVHENGVFSKKSTLKKELNGLSQYPPMINSGIFDEKVLDIWEQHLTDKVSRFFFKENLDNLDQNDLKQLTYAINECPIIFKKSIQKLVDEIKHSNIEIEMMQHSKAYKIGKSIMFFPRMIKKWIK